MGKKSNISVFSRWLDRSAYQILLRSLPTWWQYSTLVRFLLSNWYDWEKPPQWHRSHEHLIYEDVHFLPSGNSTNHLINGDEFIICLKRLRLCRAWICRRSGWMSAPEGKGFRSMEGMGSGSFGVLLSLLGRVPSLSKCTSAITNKKCDATSMCWNNTI